jgi:hypothetical protein
MLQVALALIFFLCSLPGLAASPAVSVSPLKLTFNYNKGTLPAPQSLSLVASGTGSLSWSAVSDRPWLSVTPSSGSGSATLQISVNTASLTPTSYSGHITIAVPGATGSPQAVNVSLTVFSSQLAFNVKEVTVPIPATGQANATFNLTNTGGAQLNWTAASQTSWLQVSPPSGTAPAQLQLLASLSGYAPGTYRGNVRVTAPGAAGSPATLAFTALVSSRSTPTLQLGSSSLGFTMTAGGAAPNAQSLSIQDSPATAARWSAQGNQSWIVVGAAGGTMPSQLPVSVNPAGLPAGTYHGSVQIAAAGLTGSPASVAVNFTINPASVPTLQVDPSSLSFTMALGGAAPNPKSVGIQNSAATSASWTAHAVQSWIVLPETSWTTPAQLPVSVDPAGLKAGTYLGSVQITSVRLTGSPASVPVTFTVSPTSLYNGIVLPSAWPPLRTPSQVNQVPSYLLNPPALIPIDVGRQLFVDDFLIDSTTLSRTAHRPTFYSGNPVLSPSGFPDSHDFAMPYSDGVWYDPADKLFKIFYFGGYGNMICYAYSSDGKNWTKPALPDAVVKNTNMVLQIGGGRDSATVWMDLADPNPARKFKVFAAYPQVGGKWNYLVWFSADGIHWTRQSQLDTSSILDRSTMFYNPFRKVWVKSARYQTSLPATPERPARTGRIRVRGYSESPDLVTWTPSDPTQSFWTGPEVDDPPYAGPGGAYPELYNLDATPYESLLVGLFSWWNPGPAYDSGYGPGPDLVELGVGFSRDGFSWVRPTRGGGDNAFIPATNVAGTWNAYNTQSAGGGFLVVEDELWFYFSGRTQQKPASGVSSTGLATLRRDGFYSMDAAASEGMLTTRVVQFSGSYLFVNVADPQGSLSAEILDPNGNVIQPFSRQNSNAVSVDSTSQSLTWGDVTDLSAVAHRPVKLRLYLTNGSVYSFWVTADPHGASNGYVAGGGPGFSGPTDTIGR